MNETGIFNVFDVLDNSNHKHLGETSPKLAQPKESIIAGLHFWDNVFSEVWCDRAYKYSTNEFEEKGISGSNHIANKPWGAYATTDDILATSVTSEQLWQEAEVAPATNKAELFEKAIAVEAIRALLLPVDHGLYTIDGTPFDLSRSHGCAVWCLSSDEGASVDYHIDYAELFRYETGIIIPPLAAGTIQILDVDCAMEGGEFMANSEGIAHYRKFGYKGHLAGEGVLETELAQGSGWVTVRFKRGRGILHCGLWPHLSLPVRKIGLGKRRVVLGLNLFPVFGPLNECCLRAPEHSRAFNRTVKLYQALNGMTVSLPTTTADQHEGGEADTSGGGEVDGSGKGSSTLSPRTTISGPSAAGSGQGVTATAFLKNKPLGRLLVMAARRLKEAKAKEG